jgi:hypothetical protein
MLGEHNRAIAFRVVKSYLHRLPSQNHTVDGRYLIERSVGGCQTGMARNMN